MAASMPAAEALSFLKETRGALTWPLAQLAKYLNISIADAKEVVAVLQLQGYVKPSDHQWLTTQQGEAVSRSRQPRYPRAKVEQAVADLRDRLKLVNRDTKAPYKVTDAVAFGDFLGDGSRVQAADVGIRLVPRKPDDDDLTSAREQASEQAFLRRLKNRSALLNVRPYEDWMSARSHRRLL
jgi:hypothetical protein